MRMKIIFVLLLICLSTHNSIPTVDVFVESLCPDCMQFINGSFKAFLGHPDADQLAIVNFYPFGNAKETQTDTGFSFTCQHGPNECYGNMIESCALHLAPKGKGFQILLCIEENIVSLGKDFNKAVDKCIDGDLKTSVQACVHSDQGEQLEHEMSQKTPAEHKYVPWVVFNGVHDQDAENKILDNMVDFLCGLTHLDSCKRQSGFVVEEKGTVEHGKCLNNIQGVLQ